MIYPVITHTHLPIFLVVNMQNITDFSLDMAAVTVNPSFKARIQVHLAQDSDRLKAGPAVTLPCTSTRLGNSPDGSHACLSSASRTGHSGFTQGAQ